MPPMLSAQDIARLAQELAPMLRGDSQPPVIDPLPDKLAALDKLYAKQTQLQAKIPADLQASLLNVQSEIDVLKSDICAVVVERGETVTGDALQAVFYQGKATWDSKALDAYSISVPELLKYRKLGKPYATIRPIKRDEN